MSTETFDAALLDEAAPAVPMSPRTRTALGVLGASAVAGLAADALLRAIPWGLNLALYAAVFCALAVGLDRWAGASRARAAWMAPVLAFGALAAWRDSPVLKGIDLLALAVILALAAHHAQGGSVRLAGIGRYAVATLLAWTDAAFGALALLVGTRWSELPRRGLSRHVPAVLRGLLLAVPALLLFGTLLVSADAGFERLVDGIFRLDAELTVAHVAMTLVFAWMAAGAFRALHLVDGDRLARLPGRPAALSVGPTEVCIVLGTLNLLFLAFVAVQVRWLFGGAAVVAASPSLGYAEYARRGFFELVTVAGLVLPMLLVLHWMLRADSGGSERLFRVLAGVQVALLYVIMASAMRRMWLYQQAYGLTEMRVYTTAFMAWLAAVFAWFALTVLRGLRDRFAFGALTAGLLAAAALHVADPDALILRVNTARADLSTHFDASYAAGLSGDAVPGLLAALPRLPAGARCTAARHLAA
ncbi:MAG: hypothetical protein JWM27_3951, partial [Gemmatimonadetes bacterium]|nr:hypothetical protein [Gemmatimonadota bacterium]